MLCLFVHNMNRPHPPTTPHRTTTFAFQQQHAVHFTQCTARTHANDHGDALLMPPHQATAVTHLSGWLPHTRAGARARVFARIGVCVCAFVRSVGPQRHNRRHRSRRQSVAELNPPQSEGAVPSVFAAVFTENVSPVPAISHVKCVRISCACVRVEHTKKKTLLGARHASI